MQIQQFKEFGIAFHNLAALTLEVCPTLVSPLKTGQTKFKELFRLFLSCPNLIPFKIIYVAWAMSINRLFNLNTNVYFHLKVKWKPI